MARRTRIAWKPDEVKAMVGPAHGLLVKRGATFPLSLSKQSRQIVSEKDLLAHAQMAVLDKPRWRGDPKLKSDGWKKFKQAINRLHSSLSNQSSAGTVRRKLGAAAKQLTNKSSSGMLDVAVNNNINGNHPLIPTNKATPSHPIVGTPMNPLTMLFQPGTVGIVNFMMNPDNTISFNGKVGMK